MPETLLAKQREQKKARGTYKPLTLEDMDKKMLELQAKAEVGYHQEFQEMKEHQRRLTGEEQVIVRKIEKLRPTVDALLNGTGKGLTRNAARAALKYRELHQRLYRVRAAIRIAYTRGVPIGSRPNLPVPKSAVTEQP